ncbi:serine/threonine-protein kinase [Luteimonas aquatica]|uniref:serine/threonine-protein kinase n=1 Tax=Luteimonas aquatica TaxID=450364 RepID=UPI001F5A572B|nr:serine/threonine-protein kinase [Luteimonas aquatica]
MPTDTVRWSQAAALFAHAIELDPQARAAFLDQECTGDAALRAAVQRLLEAHDALGTQTGVPGVAGWQETLDAWADANRLASGDRAGPFTIERELGLGGMGRVYLARRAIDRGTQNVALKVATLHRLTPQAHERLRRERQLLASLEHPHIARLIDAGELATGAPYFAMEYVDGLAITAYCDRHVSSIEARLRLMLEVLSAVDYAHKRLVLHRDIKASNVLVDAAGAAKLLDFGIAKPLPGESADGAEVTVEAQRFFSPGTAAPEQVGGQATSVATDIYSLGALLYELLAGRLPFEPGDYAPAQLVYEIVRVDAPPASQAVARLAQADPQRAREIALRRGVTGAQALQRRLRGDLDAVLARALRKEPERRYASVEKFADDLRAVLASRPVAARQGETGYRFGKFVRRNAIVLAAAGVVAVLSMAFVIGTVLQSRQLAQARDRAEARRAQAEQVTGFMVDLFKASDPEQARGNDPSARELLARGSRRLATGQIRDPETHAALSTAIADIDLALNDYSSAERHSADALRLRESLPGTPPSALRESYRQRARLAMATAKYADADRFLARAMATLPSADDAKSSEERLELLGLRASLLQSQGRLDQSLALWRRLDPQYQRQFGPADPRSLQARLSLASALKAAGRQEEAATLLDAALREPDAIGIRSNDPAVAKLMYALALQRRDQGHLGEAERLALAAAQIDIRVLGEDHTTTAAVYNGLGTIAQARGDSARSVGYFERSLAIKRRVHGNDHPRVAMAEYNLGLLQHLYLHDAAKAEPHLREAVAIGERGPSPTHLNVAIHRLGLAAALDDLGRRDEAMRLLALAQAQFARLPGQTGNLALARAENACLRRRGGRATAADERAMHEALEIARRRFGEGDPQYRRLQRCGSEAPGAQRR